MSITKIRAAFDCARQQLESSARTDTWMGGYCQLANRLTWALWLRAHHVDTVFAHVLFADDRSNIPGTSDELRVAAHQAHAMLGVPGSATAGGRPRSSSTPPDDIAAGRHRRARSRSSPTVGRLGPPGIRSPAPNGLALRT
jgi:hypothetical protein